MKIQLKGLCHFTVAFAALLSSAAMVAFTLSCREPVGVFLNCLSNNFRCKDRK